LFRGRLGHVNHCVTFAIDYIWETVRDRGLVQSKEPPIANGMRGSRELEGSNSWPPIRLSQYVENGWI